MMAQEFGLNAFGAKLALSLVMLKEPHDFFKLISRLSVLRLDGYILEQASTTACSTV